MTNRLSLIAATAAAVLAASLAAGSAQAHDGAYGYAGYADEGPDCGRDQFTILGAHVGATVLGFNAGVGGHFGFGDGCRRHHRYAEEPQGYGPPEQAPPPVDPYPAAYPQAPWGAPYAYRTYGPPAYPQGPGPEEPGYGGEDDYGPGYAPPPPGDQGPCDVCAPEPGWR